MNDDTTIATSSRQHSSTSEAAERTAAIALWVLVGAALLYGVGETSIRVAALFG
ncbi:MFS transporter small subunit [Aquipuribacter sp. MA13-6]|uniref:MFS transporter small subunit n=1 Tax=unclassified Aquipuribacter TaxID=2635084 RepID=UPI003EED13B8